MCGLTGFLTQNWNSESSNIIVSMTNSIAHRGPDAEGFFVDSNSGIALGHRRLSVVDLSATGSQPMKSSCGRYVIAYNGELYNNKELRDKIDSETESSFQWCGHSDTETLISLVSVFGVRPAIDMLNGMFAIAIWDLKNRMLHLIRDRFGEKPLYFGRCDDSVVFGSELRSIVKYPEISTKLDSIAVAQMIRYSAVPSPRSIYESISKVNPAHHVIFNHLGVEVANERYWRVGESNCIDESTYSDASASVDFLDKKLQSIVSSRMISDVPFGAFLSGGIDSSLIVSLMQQNSLAPVNTFTMGFEFDSHNEAPFAKKVAKEIGTNHTELYVNGNQALDVVGELPNLYDEPFGDSSQIPTILLSRLAKKHVTVCLTGDGGDELFGGYRRYQKADAIWEKVESIPSFVREMFDLKNRFSVAPVLRNQFLREIPVLGKKISNLEEVIELLIPQNFDEFYDGFLAQRTGVSQLIPSVSFDSTKVKFEPSEGLPQHQRMLSRDLNTYLHDVVLTKVDRASMSCGLETRAPLLDAELAEFAENLPWKIKCRDGSGKWPLVSLLKRYIPKELVDRPKMGFGVPIDVWLRGPLLEWAEDLLSESSLSQTGLIDVKAVRRLWALHKTGVSDRHYPLWNVLMFQAWLRVHEWS